MRYPDPSTVFDNPKHLAAKGQAVLRQLAFGRGYSVRVSTVAARDTGPTGVLIFTTPEASEALIAELVTQHEAAFGVKPR